MEDDMGGNLSQCGFLQVIFVKQIGQHLPCRAFASATQHGFMVKKCRLKNLAFSAWGKEKS